MHVISLVRLHVIYNSDLDEAQVTVYVIKAEILVVSGKSINN